MKVVILRQILIIMKLNLLTDLNCQAYTYIQCGIIQPNNSCGNVSFTWIATNTMNASFLELKLTLLGVSFIPRGEKPDSEAC